MSGCFLFIKFDCQLTKLILMYFWSRKSNENVWSFSRFWYTDGNLKAHEDQFGGNQQIHKIDKCCRISFSPMNCVEFTSQDWNKCSPHLSNPGKSEFSLFFFRHKYWLSWFLLANKNCKSAMLLSHNYKHNDIFFIEIFTSSCVHFENVANKWQDLVLQFKLQDINYWIWDNS